MNFRLIGLIGLIGLISPMGNCYAQEVVDSGIVFRLDAQGFYHDNEYSGNRMTGYTLPGFTLQPKIVWGVNDHVSLKVGVHWLHYWGAHGYPASTFDTPWPAVGDTGTTAVHILPWVQLSSTWGSLDEGFRVELGSLRTSDHGLPLPLFNRERLFATDPEAGFALRYWNPWLKAEVWCDWRSFIWYGSSTRESLTAGAHIHFSLFGHKETNDWILYIPLTLVGQHSGGQGRATWSPGLRSFNATAGIVFSHQFFGSKSGTEGSSFDIGCHVAAFGQGGHTEIPFNRGWGIYPEVAFEYKNFEINAGYWYGKDFVPLLGSWHFSNLSAASPWLTIDCNKVITVGIEYTSLYFNDLSQLTFEARLYHYLEATGNDGNVHSARNQFSIGCILNVFPSIRLR